MANDTVRVLLIEDNPADARLVVESLADANATRFVVEPLARLAPGLERLKRGGIDVVLLDLSLPDSQGIDTFTRARRAAPSVPFVLLTGLSDESVAEAAVRTGAQDYIVKGHADAYALARSIRYALERQRASEEMERLRRQLAESERSAALGALVAGITAEIREASTNISNTVFRLRQEVQEAGRRERSAQAVIGKVGEATAAAMEGLERVDKLFRELRRFTIEAASARVNVGLEVPVAAAVELFARTPHQGIVVKADLLPTGPLAMDVIQLQQVVASLLHNAADAMPRGGTIEVRTHNVAGGAALEVVDQGLGIPTNVQARLFEPLFTTKHGHVGLGLAVARRLVEAHGGTIRFETMTGRGTTFVVQIPATQDPTDRAA